MEAYVFRIRGRVQGVGFRWFTERAASRHGVRGHVRNLEDGSVEVFAQAEHQAMEGFRTELSAGPRAARVDDIQVAEVAPEPSLAGFEVRS